MKHHFENIWALVLTWKISEIIVFIFDILPGLAILVSFILSTIVSLMVIRYYKDKKSLSILERRKIELEIQNEELLLRKKDELNLKD